MRCSRSPAGGCASRRSTSAADRRGRDWAWRCTARRSFPRGGADDQVNQLLNEALKNELTAINQYWLHYRMLDNWGVKRLAEYERHESIDEMKHADRLAERILFLDGLPNFQMLGRLRIGETIEEVLRADLELEREALGQLQGAIAHCESVRDYVSRELFESILTSEEEHVDFLERQFDLIKQIGIERYVMLNAGAANHDE